MLPQSPLRHFEIQHGMIRHVMPESSLHNSTPNMRSVGRHERATLDQPPLGLVLHRAHRNQTIPVPLHNQMRVFDCHDRQFAMIRDRKVRHAPSRHASKMIRNCQCLRRHRFPAYFQYGRNQLDAANWQAPEIVSLVREANEMGVSGSTLARRALGRELRRLRITRGMNQAEAARAAETSPQSISRTEEGQSTRLTSFQINALCNVYGASDSERKLLLGLLQEVRSSRERGGGWWRAYADEMNPGFDHYVVLERAARRLAIWRLAMIPGLLQTPEYRRAMAWTENPAMPTDQLEKRIEMAIRRQTRLEDKEFAVDVVLSEMVLRDDIGGAAVMVDQLQRLVDLSQLDHVSIRAVRFRTPGHLGSLVGSFALLEFPKLPVTGLVEPPMVFVEGYAGDLYLEREGEVDRYRNAFGEIARVALDQDTTRQLILSIVEEFRA
ncbi:helix-turn-helix domain-containing protein [Nocardia sp. NPDC059240]|uniref:helix-turn-helix domain-containing protein n=1 Tax=Nocardia sp. NPDC059240 TaxID=3346786 RepID=UPI0036B4E1F9